MQCIKMEGMKLKAVINMFLSSLGLVNIYIFQTNSNKEVFIVGCSTNDFLCAYYVTHIFQYFCDGIEK